MPNSTAGLFETLVVPAATSKQLVPRYKNRMLDLVYNDYKSTYGTVGQTTVINIPVVDETKVADIGSGGIALSDTAQNQANITINHKMSSSRTIQSFDQVRSPVNMRELYVQPMVEEVLRKSNRALAAYVSETSFPNYAKIAGGTNEFSRLNVSAAWQNVAGAGGAPVNSKDTFFITDQVPYGNMLGDTTLNFIQQFVVGTEAAVMAQQDARLMPSFNAALDWDQTIPSDTAGKHGALYFHRMAIGLLPVLEPQPEDSYIKQITIFPTADKRFPVTIQFWHDPKAQGHVIHVFATFGSNVVNPAWGSYLETV